MQILYLFPHTLYQTKMSAGRCLYGEAVGRQPDVDLEFWGQGWPGYVDELPLAENLKRSGKNPDVLWIYKADRLREPEKASGIKVVCFNEAWGEQYIREADCADVVIFHHESDMRLWRERLEARGARAVHSPHCADHSLSVNPPLAERPIDCLLTGVHAPEVYPLRARLRGLVESGAIPGELRKHPGYRLLNHEAVMLQYADYCDHLEQAKISLCCSSKWRYGLAKITESMMAGCAVVTDCPDGSLFREKLWPYCIQIDAAWPDEMIVGLIRDWLSRPNDLARLAERGRQAVLAEFTSDDYARRFVEAVGVQKIPAG